MIEKQRKEEGEAYISTVLFDNQAEVLYGKVLAAANLHGRLELAECGAVVGVQAAAGDEVGGVFKLHARLCLWSHDGDIAECGGGVRRHV